ncbi:MAG: OmpA family protein [Deltaproteobacteria bacterium]|nr:OmpA family protein [Deltaproteobacteria bacterium]
MRLLAMGVVLPLMSAACVTTGTFDKKVAELKTCEEREKDLQGELASTKDTLAKRTTERDELQHRLNDTTALAGELKTRLEKLGQNVDQLTSEKGQLAAGLNDAKERLEELRKQKAAAEATAATFRGLVARLKAMIDAGTIKVTIRNGRMLLALPNDVLFDSGKTALKEEGKAALVQVAQALGTINDRRFMVAGHTDNVPIKTSRFPSNWELSTARAVEVTRLLIEAGMKPGVLSAAGYGEFDPVAPNDTPENKGLNRRIEIVLEPNLSDLPSLQGLLQ